MRRKYPQTEWGIKVTNFRMRYGYSLKELCNNAGVPESSLQAAAIGKAPSTDTVSKVDAYIAHIEATCAAPAPQPFH